MCEQTPEVLNVLWAIVYVISSSSIGAFKQPCPIHSC